MKLKDTQIRWYWKVTTFFIIERSKLSVKIKTINPASLLKNTKTKRTYNLAKNNQTFYGCIKNLTSFSWVNKIWKYFFENGVTIKKTRSRSQLLFLIRLFGIKKKLPLLLIFVYFCFYNKVFFGERKITNSNQIENIRTVWSCLILKLYLY